MNYLAVFSITPVQGYINRARKLRDLYAGSKILSFLASVGLKVAINKGGKAVYPPDTKSSSVPNKFVFTIDAENTGVVKEVMGRIEETIHAEWLALAEITGVPSNLIDDYWQYSWAALPWNKDKGDYPKTHSKLQGLLAATKLKPNRIRKSQAGEKCPLCGENQVWRELKDNFGRTEKLCGVCAIKRLLPESKIPEKHDLYDLSNQKNFPITTDLAAHRYIRDNGLTQEDIERLHNERDNKLPNIQKYYAVLLMDGDYMGDLVNKKKSPEEHSELSKTLDDFTANLRHLIAKPGRLIYAGGDDVLAVLPLDSALETAKTIRESYIKKVRDRDHAQDKKHISISAALLIVHHKEPLREAIRDAHHVLDAISKEKADRDALTIRLRKRSGGDRDMYFKWDAQNIFLQKETLLESFEHIKTELSNQHITSGLVYRLSQLKDAVLAEGINREQIVKMFAYEVNHSLSHTIDMEVTVRRLAGLSMTIDQEQKISDFNPEVPVIAHFLSGAEK
jgi:CRISPR-associated protein Cmr2